MATATEVKRVRRDDQAEFATSGTCRSCGCTDANACPDGCEWANAEHTLCSRCDDKISVTDASVRPIGAAASLPIAAITNELNPREHFDAEKLAALAATIRTSGLIQPLAVRRHPMDKEKFQLLAGGRRLKAAQKAGLKDVPCLIRENVSDAEALEIALIENFQREDLSPIEEARAFQEFCKPEAAGGLGYTQQRLADRLGCSQPHIANRLRLLHLPDKWQQRIITGEISHSLARHLLPVAKHKPILAEIERSLKSETVHGDPVTEDNFQQLVGEAVREHTRALCQAEYLPGIGRVEILKEKDLSDDEREQLGIIEVQDRYSDGMELRATNVHFWETLVKTKRAELEAKAAKKAERADKRESAAEKKRTPAEAKASAAKKAEQYGRWLADWKLDWYRLLIAERLKKFNPKPLSDAGRMVPTKLLLWLAVNHDYKLSRHDDLDAATRSQIPESLNQASWGFNGVRSIQASNVPALANEFLRNLLYHDQEGPSQTFPAEVIEPTIEDLEIKPSDEWLTALAGPLTDAYFDLHSKDQLDELALAWQIDTSAPEWTKAKKSERIELLKASSVIRAKLPAELRPPEAAKKRAKKTAKTPRAPVKKG